MDPHLDIYDVLFFDQVRQSAIAAYAANPQDADNLTRWGSALLELSQFQRTEDCKIMIQESITKLEEALKLQPAKHDALWCLGNALTCQAFMNTDSDLAKMNFHRAAGYFQLAAAEDPSNELYKKSLVVIAKAPMLHAELHNHNVDQVLALPMSYNKYHVLGCLAFLGFVILGKMWLA